MTAARDDVLALIRSARPERLPAAVEVPAPAPRTREELVERFAERVADYRARVEVTDDPASAAGRELAGRRVAIASDLAAELRPPGVELVTDQGLTAQELDRLDAVLTTCAAACADTGTIALDGGPGQGRRALTLVPDIHVCIVGAEQIVGTVPELFASLGGSAEAGRPIVLVSGPSATSDIELRRVEGVHGPRTLVVLIAS